MCGTVFGFGVEHTVNNRGLLGYSRACGMG